MKKEEQAKYSQGLAESISVTVKKRKGMVTKSMYEIRTVIEDCRSQVCGGLTAGLEIWEMAVSPMLLNTAETWDYISAKTVQELQKLQLMFYQ